MGARRRAISAGMYLEVPALGACVLSITECRPHHKNGVQTTSVYLTLG